MDSVLNVTIWLPLLGAVLILAAASLGRTFARSVALMFSVGTFVLAGWLIAQFPSSGEIPEGFAVTNISWLGQAESSINIRYHVGLDGLGLWMFGLSALLMITSVLVSWDAITDREPLY